jgi:TRAP-type C4-dicarboxylate transport system permease small subunit
VTVTGGRDPATGDTSLPRGYRALNRLLWVIEIAVSVLAVGLLAFIVTANFYEICSRMLFNRSVTWLYEVNLLLSNWIYFLGISLVYFRNGDIVVDFVVQKMPLRVRLPYLLVIKAVTVAVLALIVWTGVILMQLQSSDYSMGIGIWNPLFTLPLVAGGILMIAAVCRQALAIWIEGVGVDSGRGTHL